MLALLHRLFQFFLVIAKQGVDFMMRVVADSVNLRTQLLPRSCRILIEQRLNPIVMLLEQRPDLLLLSLGRMAFGADRWCHGGALQVE